MRISGLQKLTLLDYPGHVACTVFTGGCNFRCPFCHNASLVLPERLDGDPDGAETVLAFLKKRQGILEGVAITGGEPLLHADMPELLRAIRALGYRIKLDTNGCHPDALKGVLDKGLVDYIAMDIKAPLEKYHLVGFTDTDAIRSSIALLESSGVEHEYRTTCPKTILRPEDFPQMAALIGPSAKWYLQTFNPSKTLDPAYGNESSYSEDELNQIIERYRLSNAKVR